MSCLGIVFAPLIVTIMAPGFVHAPAQFDLAVFLTRFMFPYIFFISLVALCMGILNALRHFAAPALSPVVLNIVNNQWAISTPSSAHSRTPIHVRARGFGLSSMVVDGNDVLAVYAATKIAADQVRSGGAPVVVEAMTYRMQGH